MREEAGPACACVGFSVRGLSECQDYREKLDNGRGQDFASFGKAKGRVLMEAANDFFLSVNCQAFIYHPPFLDSLQYTVKKVSGFPVPGRDVTYQTLPGRE